jgi:hypothetical protein
VDTGFPKKIMLHQKLSRDPIGAKPLVQGACICHAIAFSAGDPAAAGLERAGNNSHLYT